MLNVYLRYFSLALAERLTQAQLQLAFVFDVVVIIVVVVVVVVIFVVVVNDDIVVYPEAYL